MVNRTKFLEWLIPLILCLVILPFGIAFVFYLFNSVIIYRIEPVKPKDNFYECQYGKEISENFNYKNLSSQEIRAGTLVNTEQKCPGQLIFEENFDEFDLSRWKHDLTLSGGGHGEFQWYNNNRSNSYVEKGILHIRPTLLADEKGNDFLYSGTIDINGGSPVEGCTDARWFGCKRTGSAQNILNPIKSARIRSINSFSFRYGKMEIRAKIPKGDWLWPAIWMLPRWNKYADWPASGAIAVMESRGNKNLTIPPNINIGSQRISSALHWGLDGNSHRYSRFETKSSVGFDQNFHKYQIQWTSENIIFYLDNAQTSIIAPPSGGFWELGKFNSLLDNPWKGNGKMAPFDQEFYVAINLAVGGTNGYFPDEASNPGGKPWNNTSPRAATDFWEGREQWLPTWNMDSDDSHFQIDYIKVWAL